MTLKAPIDTKAGAVVIEAKVDRGLGVVVTALIQRGTCLGTRAKAHI
jgi:translation initiation factor IF-2